MSSSFFPNSLRPKAAAFFVLFGLLVAIEGALIIVFWNKAGAVSRQIEVVLEAEQINQTAHAGYKAYLSAQDKSSSDNLMGLFDQASDLIVTLKLGGRAGNSDLTLPPASHLSTTSLGRVAHLQENHKKSWIRLQAQQATFAELKSMFSDSMAVEKISEELQHVQASLIEIDDLAKSLHSAFRQLVKDLRIEEEERQSIVYWLMGAIVLIDLIALSYFYFLMNRKIFKPLNAIAQAAINQQTISPQSNDEIGLIATSLSSIINQIQEAANFIKSVGDGNLTATLDEDKNSALSQALVRMQQKLKSINDEDQKRKWATEGLAKFVEILRSGDSNLSTLGDNIIKGIVSYTEATQGGLYVWNDDKEDDPYLELVASYAFNRKKYDKKIVKPGEGLLGQAFLEQATTYLTEIPADYFKIVSGLGEIDPQSILIVPLLNDSKVYGLVELASFKKFADHEITFVEKLGESIASSVAAVKGNEKNKKLLEDFQEQTESLQSHDEEMRQNMEELTATQEEMSRKENDYIRQIEELKEQLKQATADGQWEIAREAGDALKTNLQALNIAMEELRKSN